MVDTAWFARAACRGLDTEVFYSPTPEDQADALAVCAVCPVRLECLTWVLETGDAGVWGGQPADERDKWRWWGRRRGLSMAEVARYIAAGGKRRPSGAT